VCSVFFISEIGLKWIPILACRPSAAAFWLIFGVLDAMVRSFSSGIVCLWLRLEGQRAVRTPLGAASFILAEIRETNTVAGLRPPGPSLIQNS
jgi:hypothetical protein